MDAVERVSELQLNLKKSGLRTMLRINALLTPQQRVNLRELQRERKRSKGKDKRKRRPQRY